MDDSALIWRVVLHSLADEFLHSVADDDLSAFNNVVGDLGHSLYTNSASDAIDYGIYDDDRDYSREMMMMLEEMVPKIMMLEMILEMMMLTERYC